MMCSTFAIIFILAGVKVWGLGAVAEISVRILQIGVDGEFLGEIDRVNEDEVHLTKEQHFSGENRQVVFECNSSIPVEWTFDGPVQPYFLDGVSDEHRTYRSHGDAEAETFSAQLKFSLLSSPIYTMTTGKYACRGVQDSTLNSSLYLYMWSEGWGQLVHFTPWVRFWPSQLRQLNFQVSVLDNGSVHVPLYCHQPNSNQFEISAQVADGMPNFPLVRDVHYTYDCRSGLFIHRDRFPYSVDRLFVVRDFAILLMPRIDEIITVSPNVTFIDTDNDEDIEFSCESSRNVTAVWTDGGGRHFVWVDNVTETYADWSELPFQLSWTLNPAQNTRERYLWCMPWYLYYHGPWVGDLAYEWEVADTESDPVLSPVTNLTLNPITGELECCTTSETASPVLEFLACDSVPDCRLQHFRLMASRTRTPEPYEPCIAKMTPVGRGVAVACVDVENTEVVQDDYPFLPFSFYNGSLHPLNPKFIELPTLQYILQIGVFIMTAAAPSEVDSINPVIGLPEYITCYANGFYLSDGLHWAMEYANGTLLHVDSPHQFDIDEDVLGGMFIQLGTELTFEDFDVVRLYCIAPTWNSDAWVNISIAIHVQEGPPTTPEVATTLQTEVEPPTTTDGLSKAISIQSGKFGVLFAFIVIQLIYKFIED